MFSISLMMIIFLVDVLSLSLLYQPLFVCSCPSRLFAFVGFFFSSKNKGVHPNFRGQAGLENKQTCIRLYNIYTSHRYNTCLSHFSASCAWIDTVKCPLFSKLLFENFSLWLIIDNDRYVSFISIISLCNGKISNTLLHCHTYCNAPYIDLDQSSAIFQKNHTVT